jgi:hypothetical protein
MGLRLSGLNRYDATGKYRSTAMEVRQYIRPDVAASAIVHLSVLGLVFFFTEVHPFGSVTAEPIAVDIVTADQLEKAEAKIDQKPLFPSTDSLTKDDAAAAAPPGAPPAPQKASPPQKEASAPKDQPPKDQPPKEQKETSAQKKEARREAALQQQPSPQPQTQPPQQPQPQQLPAKQPDIPVPPPQAQSPPPPPSSSLGYVPPEPDVTVKYHVMLGLPPDLPVGAPPSSSGDKPGDGIDATASKKADLAASLIEDFRKHLKTCSKLPASVARSDNVRIKLRVIMLPSGKLATEPILIEGTASMKGLEMKQSAVQALTACQPYDMLPANRYGEWKVLDLSFTPDDFSS